MIDDQLPFLQILSSASKDAFVRAVQRVRFPRNHTIVEPGQIARHAYFVMKGAIRQFTLADGKEVVTRLITEGGFSTALYSFISGKPSFEYCQTLEEVEAISLSRQDMERLCADHIDIANLERKITEQYLIQEQERALSLQFLSAQERYEQLFRLDSTILLRFPLGTIASYLGMSQETLSRLRAKTIA
jgi:CRP-like cAMP-binding protein